MDLSLVSIDDLVKEIEGRTTSFICAYELPYEKVFQMKFNYGHGKWFKSVQLSSILNNDVLNNWNGELKTLQRINEEADD